VSAKEAAAGAAVSAAGALTVMAAGDDVESDWVPQALTARLRAKIAWGSVFIGVPL